MISESRSVIVIGGGAAGLCAGVYARSCGYEVQVLEMNDSLGGLATSWRRGEYTFENCLHWLLGAKEGEFLHETWKEVMDIEKLEFVPAHEYALVETEGGESLTVYRNTERLANELLVKAPEDRYEIHRLMSTLGRLDDFEMPDYTSGWMSRGAAYLHDVPYLPLLHELSGMSCAAYGERFTSPLVRAFFGEGRLGEMPVLALLLSMVWMHKKNAEYPVGGSQAVIRAIAERLASVGGRARTGAKVRRILMEHDDAVGVELVGGERLRADWVISAADGHETIYDLLGGRYLDAETQKIYETMVLYPSYVQVSLGVAKDLRDQPAMLLQVLDTPLEVDPETRLRQMQVRFFHFDPTFAPKGKTAVTCFLPTTDFPYWKKLAEENPDGYQREKERIANEVIAVLGRRLPGLAEAIEVRDVSTPVTVHRYTGNWRGSMEGWLMRPGRGYGPLPNTLTGLGHFLMAGQWVVPGGGLPSCLMSARLAVQAMCREDGEEFVTVKATEVESSGCL